MRIKLNLRKKLFLSIIGSLFVLNTILMTVTGRSISNQSKQTALELSMSKSKEVALTVEGYLNQAVETGNHISNTFIALKRDHPSREDIKNILIETLRSNSQYKAVWTMWEKDCFDSLDDRFLDHADYLKTEGRLNLSFYKDNNSVLMEPGTIEQYQEDFYTLGQRSRSITILDPYMYSYTGDDADQVYETTIAVPVMDGNRWLGVVGIDIELHDLQVLVQDLKFYKNGFASVISNDVQITAHPDNRLIMKKMDEVIPASNLGERIQRGETFELNTKKASRIFYPVNINGVTTPWSIMIEVPFSEVYASANRITWITGVLNLIFLILLSIIVYYISVNLSIPIVRGVKVAKEIAAGQITSHQIGQFRQDEIGDLMKALDTMSEKLTEVVSAVKRETAIINESSLHLSSSADVFSQGATEQASTIEEVSSTMEEVAMMIQSNADNAQTTQTISVDAQNSIKEVISHAVKAMEASKIISGKINVINDIAFQTNILALNAAVEAARAGEHGLGFSVVADEVRRLADSSKVAAEDISKLIIESLRLNEESGRRMIQLLPEIEKSTNLIVDISQSSLQQAQGIMQVNNAIIQLNNVAQSNASASELLAEKAMTLSNQAESLKSMMSYFEIEN